MRELQLLAWIREYVGPCAAALAEQRRRARLAREHRAALEDMFLWARR